MSGPSLLRISPSAAVWRVGWPMIALGLLRSSLYLTDSYWVGRLGDPQLAAIGGSAFGWWMIYLWCGLAATGAHSLVARHEGAGDRAAMGPTLTQGLWVGAALTAVLLALTPFRGLYFDLLGFPADSEAHRHGREFLRASLMGAGTLAVAQVLDAAFRGLGRTRTALAISAGTVLANAALDPLLIHGLGPVPGLGVAGAAWATALANGVGAVLAFVVLRRAGLRLPMLGPDLTAARRIAAIGTPITASGIGFSAVYVVLGRIINDFGEHQMAALGVGHRLESLAYMFCVGLSVGAATMVGQHVGAKDLDKAEASGHAAMGLAIAPMLGLGVLLASFAEPAFSLFSDDHRVIEAGVVYLRVQSLVFVFMAAEAIYEGAFTGTGNTVPAFWITAIGTTGRLPLAWLLAYPAGLGVLGVWIAIAGSTVLKGIAIGLWFRRGGWRISTPSS